MLIKEQIADLLKEKFEEKDYSDCFLVEVNQNNSKLEVFIDSDSSLTLARCQRISRFLEKHIEENEWMGEKYILEVSSPGVGRPLVFERQYAKNLGRKLEVKLNEGGKKTGTLTNVTEKGIQLEEKVRIKEGKKKRTQMITHDIEFEQIAKAVVKISFNK